MESSDYTELMGGVLTIRFTDTEMKVFVQSTHPKQERALQDLAEMLVAAEIWWWVE